MIRIVLAALAALTLAACNPSVKFDPADPWKTLHPWQHNWAEVQRLPTGVEYIVLRKGDGKGGFPSPADKVEVMYEGRFADSGEVFDTSYEDNMPVTFRLNEVIRGWTDGLGKMQPGDMFLFWIPWDQAYGEDGGGRMPPRSDLMFKVELNKIIPAVSPDATAWAKATPWPTDSSDVIRRPSGLEYMVIESGPADGISPSEDDDVVLHFQGRLEGVEKEDGETDQDVVDRSIVLDTYESQSPMAFPVSQLVSGWNEMVKQMRKGDHWMVRMPPHLFYGDEGDGRIPAGATVVLEMRLEDFYPHRPEAGDLIIPPQR